VIQFLVEEALEHRADMIDAKEIAEAQKLAAVAAAERRAAAALEKQRRATR